MWMIGLATHVSTAMNSPKVILTPSRRVRSGFACRTMQFSLRRLFLVVTVAGIALGLICGFVRSLTYIDQGEHVNKVSWLPTQATNVAYYRSYVFTAFEFDIPEADFRYWARQWDVQPITRPQTILRYSFYAHVTHDPAHPQHARLHDGLYYEHRQSNGGGVAVGYDRELGRAYFCTTPR